MAALVLTALVILAFAFGRASKPTIKHYTREGQCEHAIMDGYAHGRLKINVHRPNLEDLNLALHRQEGLLGAVRDNYDDLHLMAKKLNGEYDEKTDAQRPETN